MPRYDGRDGYCGTSTYTLPNVYETLALAERIANNDPDQIGDETREVIEARTGRPLRELQVFAPESRPPADDCPF